MADVIKRLKYYNGQFLQEPDFTAEQDYHLDRQRRHNRMLHTPGIADGLAVTANASSTSAAVAPGTALDSQGRQIVLHESRTIGFSGSLSGKTALVVISYAEEEADDATVGDAGKTRWKEVPRVEAILDDGLPLGDRIPLGRLQIAANGTISSHDPSVRLPAGSRVRPDEIFDRLRLSRPQGGGQPPVLTSGASGRLDLTGELNVSGSLLVGGTVDGRDVSADGALNETHRGRTDNPHNVTAAQIGALASLDGVANPGGNIDLLSGGAISITPDDGNNRITISETHSGLSGNPHGTLASQLADYDFKRIYTNYIWFYEYYGNGATFTFSVGFRPRFVWVYGYANSYMSNGWYGSSTHGFAKIDGGTITQRASGPSVTRQSGTPGLLSSGIEHSNAVCVGTFYNYLASPNVTGTVFAQVSSATADSVTFMLTRPTPVPTFDLWFHFICVGY